MAETALEYEYATEGLGVRRRSIHPGDGLVEEMHLAFSHMDAITSREALIETALAKGSQRLGSVAVLLYEPPAGKATGNVIPYYYPWSGNVTKNRVGQLEAAAIAAQNPGSTVMAIDSPGTGESLRLPRAVMREIAKTGSYLPYGELTAPMLESFFADYDSITYMGSSQGARRAAAMAWATGEMLDRPTQDLILQDPVGSHEQTVRSLISGMMREGVHSGRYVKASPDHEAAHAQRLNDSWRALYSIGRVARHGALVDLAVGEPRALARPGLEGDLQAAIPHVQRTLVVNTPEFSELTQAAAAQAMLERLAAGLADGPGPEHIEHRLVRGTHSMFAGYPHGLGRLLVRDLMEA